MLSANIVGDTTALVSLPTCNLVNYDYRLEVLLSTAINALGPGLARMDIVSIKENVAKVMHRANVQIFESSQEKLPFVSLYA